MNTSKRLGVYKLGDLGKNEYQSSEFVMLLKFENVGDHDERHLISNNNVNNHDNQQYS